MARDIHSDHITDRPSGNWTDLNRKAERYADLGSAGRELATRLQAWRGRDDVVVLTPVLGGAPVAFEVANALGAPLDFIVIRRLLAPNGIHAQVCAVTVGGTLVIDKEVPQQPAVQSTALDYFIADALEKLALRTQVCRRGRPVISLAQKIVILVDCGICTGSTMQAAIRALRTLEPARIIAATPVAAMESRKTVEAVAEELVCLAWPHPFGHVGLWYSDFRRPADAQVGELLRGIDK